jgi:O-antigen/teichoic acid export membrane protein
MDFNQLISKYSLFDRGQKRLFKAGISGISGLIVRFLSIAISLVSIPLISKYLGAERFGMWILISTLLNWVGIADFGLGNSLKNTLAKASALDDVETPKVAVSSVFYLNLVVAVIFTSIFFLFYPIVSWEKIFNVKSHEALLESNSVMIIVALFFSIRIVFSTCINIYSAYQQSYIYNFWEIISYLISIFGLLIAIHLRTSLPILIITSFGTPLVASFLSMIHIFYWKYPWLKPKLRYFKWNESLSLLKIGSQLWLTQIAGIIIYQTDLILVAQLFGSIDVAKYGISLRLFSIITIIQTAFTAPLWTPYTEAFYRKDYKWVIDTFKYSFLLNTLFASVLSLIFIIWGRSIILFLSDQDMVPDQNLLLCMALTTVLTSFGQVAAMLLNGMGEVKIQFLIAPVSAIVNLIASLALAHYFGLIGISLGTSISALIAYYVIAKFIFVRLGELQKSAL